MDGELAQICEIYVPQGVFHLNTTARWTYTASGPVTNLASRLAELATDGDIYLGEATAVRVQHIFPLQELGKHHVKNVQEPIAVYQVRPGAPRL